LLPIVTWRSLLLIVFCLNLSVFKQTKSAGERVPWGFVPKLSLS
jgi:hypothetical protein